MTLNSRPPASTSYTQRLLQMSQPACPRSHIFMNPLNSLIFFKTTILISSYELHLGIYFLFIFMCKTLGFLSICSVCLGLTPTFSVELICTVCGQRSLTSPILCNPGNSNTVLKVRTIPLPSSFLFISLILTSTQGSHQVLVSSFFLFVCVMNLRL